MNPNDSASKLSLAFRLLASALRPALYPDGKTPKARTSKDRKATKKGAKHKIGKHFLGRNIITFTPAQYRHEHLGRVSPRWLRRKERMATNGL